MFPQMVLNHCYHLPWLVQYVIRTCMHIHMCIYTHMDPNTQKVNICMANSRTILTMPCSCLRPVVPTVRQPIAEYFQLLQEFLHQQKSKASIIFSALLRFVQLAQNILFSLSYTCIQQAEKARLVIHKDINNLPNVSLFLKFLFQGKGIVQ